MGLISGGGVTVRSLGPDVDKDETAENSQYFYYAPYVGKAFSGYAISDDKEYKNTEKYASIAYIAAKQTPGHSQRREIRAARSRWIMRRT